MGQRVVEVIEDIVEMGPDVIDPKIIKTGSIGVVKGDIVPGQSVWVDFGRGISCVAVSESNLRDMPSDSGELMHYLKERGKLCGTAVWRPGH